MACRRFYLLICMYLTQNLCYGEPQPKPLLFKGCDVVGWSCLFTTVTLELTYECNDMSRNIVLRNTSLRLPSNTTSFTIQNCNEAVISIQAASGNVERLTNIIIKNISILTLIPSVLKKSQVVVLENIQQLHKARNRIFTGNCRSLILRNINIDHVANEAFYNLTIKRSLKWDQVRIRLLDMNAMANVIVREDFVISNSLIGTMEIFSFQVQGEKVIIENSEIDDIRYNAIVVLADQFLLVNNTGFYLVMPNAFTVYAREVVIRNNHFTYIQTEALQGITPALWEDNLRGRISYSFQNNHIEVADFGSLHVNLDGYLNARAIMLMGNNTFSCSCTHLGWLGLELIDFPEFHERFLSPDENNTCSDAPCYLPISVLKTLVQSKKNICAANLTTAELCEIYSQNIANANRQPPGVFFIFFFTIILKFFVALK